MSLQKREKEKHLITKVDFAMCCHALCECDHISVLAMCVVGQFSNLESLEGLVRGSENKRKYINSGSIFAT